MDTLGLTLLGTVAGLCTTASFVPQVVKAWRAGDTQAISLRMYWVSLAAFALWIVHGLMVERLPIVVFNAFNLVLGGLVLWCAYGFGAGNLPIMVFSALSLGLSLAILALKARHTRRTRRAET